jgi:hypothetical protein
LGCIMNRVIGVDHSEHSKNSMNTLIIAALVLLWVTAGFFYAKKFLKKWCGHHEYLEGDDLFMGALMGLALWPLLFVLHILDILAKKLKVKP